MRVTRLQWDGRDPAACARGLRALSPPLKEVADQVRSIIEDVAARGDAAVRELTATFDSGEAPAELRVDPAEAERALSALDDDVAEALDVAAQNIVGVSMVQLGLPEDAELPEEEWVALHQVHEVELPQGQRVSLCELPVSSAGIYAPGGRAAYPSSVLMSALPALAAGVPRVAVTSPPGADGGVHPAILATCAMIGIEEIYAIGGAQAIAALALGTETVPAVDVVAGPGNRYVTEAKRQLSGRVGIDGLAGPTELMVVLDRTASTDWVALDLCAQAEHGTEGLLVAASPEESALDGVLERAEQLQAERSTIADAPLALVACPDLDTSLALADAIVPEHLQLVFEGADDDLGSERVAGCVFVGPHSGAAFGDYAAGSNHVLPTGGAGRFSGPLGPGVFRRRMSVVSLPAASARELAPVVGALARAEGFPVHGESAEARTRP
jgi:histidinol dehydrogenase